ncbi:TPA: hypothetical protein N0F65_005496 [Lagenidium giganteum]|uniref:DRBM domain-containing protein n=1 Tax=Lagenidium giganteum TaxID=4803 RepID=A0AAV2YJ55_9STRA|nr:TPA: hypothetical protein N0F65_005496 [Lagenidium giganteum]
MLPQEDVELLRAALQKCDDQTKAFVGPLLPLEAVQNALVTFARDSTRSLEEWIWDPACRQKLEALREQQPIAHNHAQNVDMWFSHAMQEQALREQQQYAPSEVLREEYEARREDGKAKFRRGDFYPALNAFKKTLSVLEQLEMAENGDIEREPTEWDDTMQQNFVTMCCNIAICGIKLGDRSVIRLYADKALEVDPTCCKALYARSKLHLMEHMFEDAYAVVDKALHYHPDNSLLVKFRKEIEVAELKRKKQQDELAAAAAAAAKEAEADSQAGTQQEEDHAARLERVRKARLAEVPLPTLEDDKFAAMRLHTYYTKIKHHLDIQIVQKSNPDLGEPPLFECRMVDATREIDLTDAVQASSKTVAKNEASKLAIRKLWDVKKEAGTLLPEDLKHLEEFEEAQRTGVQLVSQHAKLAKEEQDRVAQRNKLAADGVQSEVATVHLSVYERQLNPVQLLNQLHTQKKITVHFEVTDLLPTSTDFTKFEFRIRLNGVETAVAEDVSKKKAQAAAAKETVQKAFASGLFACYEESEKWEADRTAEA